MIPDRPRMRPAVFIDTRTGRVVREGCQSVGITMTMNDEWYVALALFGMWVYVPEEVIDEARALLKSQEGKR